MKRVLLISSGLFHPPLPARRLLQRLLPAAGYAVTAIGSFEQLPDFDLSPFAACVIYLHQRAISTPALAAFDRFVMDGGGVLGLHSATASFKEAPHFFEILGGRFCGHGPVTAFQLEPAPAPNQPFDGLPALTVTDELYLHEFQPGIRVHFTAPYGGQAQPVVWTHSYGAGKVCCAVPGHLFQTMRSKAYQELLLRGLAWVSA